MVDVIVDETRLEQDLSYRIDHLKAFMGVTEHDGEIVQRTIGKLAKHAEAVVDAVYDHLFRWSSTAKYFMDEQGVIEDAFLKKRKETLTQWLVTLGEGRTDADFAAYMVRVGHKHTAAAGQVPAQVPRHYFIALMSVVQSTVADLLAQELADGEELQPAIVAWNKMLMLALELMLFGCSEQGRSVSESGAPAS